jgi:hypothetical protein
MFLLEFNIVAMWLYSKARASSVSSFMVLAIALAFISCGKGKTPQHSNGTPAWTYPLAITAASGSLRHTTNLTLIDR